MEDKRDNTRNDRLNDKYGANFVQQNIKLPKHPDQIPKTIGWSGPARSGTTALLFLLASNPQIDRVYFQPQKTLMRLGRPSVSLNAEDTLVCMKEVFYSTGKREVYDPIEVLLRAGVPPEKITWIAMLRDPLQTFSSWENNAKEKLDPDTLHFWQSHTISLWHKYKNSKIKMIPFVYELLDGKEEFVLKKLYAKIGLDVSLLDLQFNPEMISKKLIPGQSADEVYFQKYLEKSLQRGKYMYSTNSYSVSESSAKEVVALCQKDYDVFRTEAKKALDI